MMPKTINYPTKRKKAKRSKQSYRANSPEAREAQMVNLRRRWNREPSKSKVAKIAKGKITEKDLESLTVIEYATDILGISFAKRPVQ